MSAIGLHSMAASGYGEAGWVLRTRLWGAGIIRALLRLTILAALYPFAIADAAWQRLATKPTGTALAHARAAWLHRWSRIAIRLLGLRLDQRGFSPVSGIVVANHSSLLDAILLAAVRPCVFVAGVEVGRRSIVGGLARLAGTLFVDHRRRHDAARLNFAIQRAVQRRLLVVIFPECDGSEGAMLRGFASALFQPAAELGCTLTAAAISYRSEGIAPGRCLESRLFQHFVELITRCRTRAVIAFSAPAFRRGDRKQLARQLRGELLRLHAAQFA
jgi:1-acyl-sn-glycerol-3-phosphate acyltransferase